MDNQGPKLHAFDFFCSESSIHDKAINVLRNLLSSHDADSRYKDRDVKARVALLYLPVVGIVMNIVDILYNPNNEVKKNVHPDVSFDLFWPKFKLHCSRNF